ncbi:hypothetical protein EV122DRAFT_284683 [Schizophyllum commune]
MGIADSSTSDLRKDDRATSAKTIEQPTAKALERPLARTLREPPQTLERMRGNPSRGRLSAREACIAVWAYAPLALQAAVPNVAGGPQRRWWSPTSSIASSLRCEPRSSQLSWLAAWLNAAIDWLNAATDPLNAAIDLLYAAIALLFARTRARVKSEKPVRVGLESQANEA